MNANLIDQYALALAQLDAAKKVADDLKAQIVAQGEGEYASDRFALKVSSHERTTLDSTMVKEYLTKKQIEKCSKTVTVTTVSRPKLLANALAA